MKNRKPMHIGIIPDGNRRWAEQHKLSREAGYAYGLTGAASFTAGKNVWNSGNHILWVYR